MFKRYELHNHTTQSDASITCRQLIDHMEADGAAVSLLGSLNLREDVDYPTGADLLVLPYNGWEDNYPPAARVIRRLAPKRVLLDHYDSTFPPLTEPVDLSPILKEFNGLVTAMEPGRPEEV